MIYYTWLLAFFLTFCTTPQQQDKPEIIQKPIKFDEERKEMTLAYMQEHYGLTPDEPTIDPKMVVVHWTAIPSFQESFDTFYPSRISGGRTDLKTASALNVSVPYLVDRDGTIYQLMPDTLMGRHVIGLNHVAIGIENVGDRNMKLSEEQIQSNIALIRFLAEKYDIQYVIGHHEYQKFINHPLWKEKDPNYLTEKDDPGDSIMNQIRKNLPALDLKPIPQ